MVKLKRRDLLIAGGAAAVSAPLLYKFLTSWSGNKVDRLQLEQGEPHTSFILSPHRRGHTEYKYGNPEYPEFVVGEWGLAGYDMVTGETFSIDTPAVGHSCVGHPTDRNKILFISQKPGTVACEVDLKTRQVTKTFKSGDGIFFIGHAAYTQDGKYVYFTESQYGTSGFVTRRNTTDYAIEKTFPTGGIEPHELRLIDNDQTIVVSNGGVKSKAGSMTPEDPGDVHATIAMIDAKTGEIKKSITGLAPLMSPRHLAFGNEHETFLGLRRFLDKGDQQVALAVFNGSEIETFKAGKRATEKMKSWLQSMAYSPSSDILAASAPDGDVISLWRVKERRHVKNIYLLKPDGLTISTDGRYFIATSHKGRTIFIDAHTLELKQGPDAPGLNWRHCLAWNTLAKPKV